MPSPGDSSRPTGTARTGGVRWRDGRGVGERRVKLLDRLRPLLGPEVVLILGRGVGCAATFAIPVALARAFDPADFGAYKQLFLVFATLYYIAQIGMAESLFYFVPRKSDVAGRFALNSVLALGAMGLATLAALVAFAPRVAALLGNPAL